MTSKEMREISKKNENYTVNKQIESVLYRCTRCAENGKYEAFFWADLYEETINHLTKMGYIVSKVDRQLYGASDGYKISW